MSDPTVLWEPRVAGLEQVTGPRSFENGLMCWVTGHFSRNGTGRIPRVCERYGWQGTPTGSRTTVEIAETPAFVDRCRRKIRRICVELPSPAL